MAKLLQVSFYTLSVEGW